VLIVAASAAISAALPGDPSRASLTNAAKRFNEPAALSGH
jgi:hypothetical protein